MCASVARTHTHYSIYIRAPHIYLCVPPGHTYKCVCPWCPHIHYNTSIRAPHTYIYVSPSQWDTHIYVCIRGAHIHYIIHTCTTHIECRNIYYIMFVRARRTHYICVCSRYIYIYICVCARVLGHGDQCVCFCLFASPPGCSPVSRGWWPPRRPARRPGGQQDSQPQFSTCSAGTNVLADGHTASNAPDLFRPPKLSGAGPG